MKLNQLLGVGIIVTIGYYYYNAKQFAQNLSVKFKQIAFDYPSTTKYAFTRLIFLAKIDLSNPTTFNVQIKSFALDIFLKDKKITRIEKLGNVNITANSVSEIILPIEIPTLSLFTTIPNAIAFFKDKKGLALNVRGIVNTSAGDVNVNELIQIV